MPDDRARARSLLARPLTPADAEAVFELTRAAELHDTGHSLVELEDIRGDWARPSYDLGAQSVAVLDDGVLVAYGEVHRNRLEGYVHPAHRGRGIGTSLFEWSIAKARELGCDRVGQTVPVTNSGAVALLRRHGCALLYTSWILELPEGAGIDDANLPPGHRLGDFHPERDAVDVFQTFEDSFNEWPNRQPSSFADWRARTIGRSDFEPWQIVTVVADVEEDAGVERIVGASRVSAGDGEGWVDQIAVRRDARGRGLGRALLVEAFARARDHGATTSRLNTDSRTGALGLYERVGMVVAETYEHYAVELA